MQSILETRDRVRSGEFGSLEDRLIDDPDCLAELEHTYSVFRFRYDWGTVYEISWSNLADSHDRQVCMALVPDGDASAYLETVETETLGGPGVCHEVTHRLLAVD